ncbi:hypothetical protein FRB91_000622 [Serendipita sp. 411]|nr:hypothetical protein FRB91_000622 [Serendipita sp. 411]
MSTTTAPGFDKNNVETFHSMKDGVRLLLDQLQVIESLEVSQSVGLLSTGILSSLLSLERQITELSRQLCSKMQEYVYLRSSINGDTRFSNTVQGLRTVDDAGSMTSLISRCPDVFLYICELIAEEGSHGIIPLLTVNKQFYGMAMSNPVLWRKISIKFDSQLSEVNSLSTSYVHACLQRSAAASLDIVLDCREVGESNIFMENYVFGVVCGSLVDRKEEGEMRRYLYSVFDEHEGDNDVIGESLLYERKTTQVLDIINSFRGSDGTHTCRWRSALIMVPHVGRIGGEIWSLFNVNMPNLQVFRINHWNSLHLQNSLPDAAWPALRNLSVLSEIDLYNAPIKLDSLQFLDFHCYNARDIANMQALSRCVALRELTICFGGVEILGLPQINIHLPMLVSFTLNGHLRLLDYVQFRLPRLERWNIGCSPSETIPDIHAAHIGWCVWGYDNTFEAEMAFILQLLARTTSLRIERLEHPDLCLKEIREMRAQKRLPDCLRTVEVVGVGSLDLVVDDQVQGPLSRK